MRLSRTFPLLALAAALAGTACIDAPTQPAARARASLMATADSTTQLLVCPTNDTQSAQAWVGPGGGQLSVRGTTIAIPPGAVSDSTLFEIVVPASRYMETDIHAVGQSQFQFLVPATITINFARCPDSSIPVGANLEGAYIDTSTYQVLQVMGGVVDKTGHKISFDTPHLSGYVVAY